MKIAVVGPGAVGCLFGGLLSVNPLNDVWLVGRRDGASANTLEAAFKSGLTFTGETEGIFKNMGFSSEVEDVGNCDLVLLTTKVYSTRDAVSMSLPLVSPETIVLILQNGLGQESIIEEFIPLDQVLRGITNNGVLPGHPGCFIHAGRGETIIGGLSDGQEQILTKVKMLFDGVSLDTRISSDIQADVWLKALVNAGINPVGALYKKTNGELFDEDETRTLVLDAVLEGWDVAKALGVKLPEDPVKKVVAVGKATYPNRNSMWIDLEAGRKTEIDAINGYIIMEGNIVGVPTPVNQMLHDRVTDLEVKL